MLPSELKAFSIVMKLNSQVEELQEKYPTWLFRKKGDFLYGFGDVLVGENEDTPIALRISLHGIFVITPNPIEPVKLTVSNCLSMSDLIGSKGEVNIAKVGEGFEDGSFSFIDSFYDLRMNRDYQTVVAIFNEIMRPFVEN